MKLRLAPDLDSQLRAVEALSAGGSPVRYEVAAGLDELLAQVTVG